MKYILRIGHTDYFLPDYRGISTVMETLSRARTIQNRRYDDDYNMVGFTHGPAPEMSAKPLVGSWKPRSRPNSSETVECEVLPPVRGALPAARARARLAGGRLMLEGGGE